MTSRNELIAERDRARDEVVRKAINFVNRPPNSLVMTNAELVSAVERYEWLINIGRSSYRNARGIITPVVAIAAVEGQDA